MHGSFWYLEVPTADAEYLSIPILEFLGVVINLLVFESQLEAAVAAGARILLRTDALTAALTLPAESQRSPMMVAVYQWLQERESFQRLRPWITVEHLFGDANPFGDFASRAKWRELSRLCAQVGLKPTHVVPAIESSSVKAASSTPSGRSGP